MLGAQGKARGLRGAVHQRGTLLPREAGTWCLWGEQVPSQGTALRAMEEDVPRVGDL